jgi:hypothetical protein
MKEFTFLNKNKKLAKTFEVPFKATKLLQIVQL